MPRAIRRETIVTLPFSPEEIWPFVADTDRMNRAVGLPSAHYIRERRVEGGEEVTGEFRFGRLLIARWTEHPFEWVRPHRFSVLREYSFGILRRFFNEVELIPEPGGTRVRLFAEFVPRRLVYDPVFRFWIAPVTVHRARRQYESIGEFLAGRSLDPFPDLTRLRSPVNPVHLDGCMHRLESVGAPTQPATELRRMLAEGADEDMAGIRPLEQADRWGTDQRETLETFLQATVAGMLEMRWELLCPSCRGVKAEAKHLQNLEVTAFCDACNLPFAASVDESIEARFYPSPTVREVNVGTYCVGSPTNTPHRLAQIILNAGQTRDWRPHLSAGSYLVRSPQSRGVCRLHVDRESDLETVDLRVGRESFEPPTVTVGVGDIVIQLINEMDVLATVAIDDAQPSETAATPSQLITLPAFRSLFSAEALAPDVELAITRVGLLFSDLAGSTALYERIGEARAFRLVNDHFTILRGSIEAAGGVVVKTIGDAMMGAFPDGRSALKAALAIQRDIRGLDTQGLADVSRLVKVGVHSGPAYVVTLSERLDYFGTTVNLAARAQHEAHGGEVIATEAILDEAEDILISQGLHGEWFEVGLRGLGTKVRLYRIDTSSIQNTSLHIGQTATQIESTESERSVEDGRAPAR